MPISFPELPFFDDTEFEEAGTVFLSEKLHSKKGKIISSLIIYLTVLHPIGEFHLFLNNWVSGCLRTAFIVHDGIQQLPRPGHRVGCGKTASGSSIERPYHYYSLSIRRMR